MNYPLLHRRVTMSPREEIYMCLVPWFLCRVLQFLWLPPKGCSLITWLWRPGGGLYSWILWNYSNWRDNSWQVTTLQSFCEEGIFACLGALELRGRLQIWYIPLGMELFSRNVGCGHHLGVLPLPCSSSPVSPIKEYIYLSGALTFATDPQGTPPDCLALGARGLMLVVPQDCIYLHTFKS